MQAVDFAVVHFRRQRLCRLNCFLGLDGQFIEAHGSSSFPAEVMTS
jgi:hypothetical protein